MDMKKTAGFIVVFAMFFAMQSAADERLSLKSKNDKDNYTAGVAIIKKLQEQGGVVNLDALIQGMKDALNGKALALTDDASAPMAVTTAVGRDAAVPSGAKPGQPNQEAKPAMPAASVDVLVMQKTQGMQQPAAAQQTVPSGPNARSASPYMYRDYATAQRVKEKAAVRAKALENGTAGNE
jgi:hypothetical protein